MPAVPLLVKRSSSANTALIAAAVVTCVGVALLTVIALWIYSKWLRRHRDRMARLEKEHSTSPSLSDSSVSSGSPHFPRPPRRSRRPLITKPSIPDLPRISEEPRMSLEPRASVSASVQSRPATVMGSGVDHGGAGEFGEHRDGKNKEAEKEEVMDS